MASLEDVLKAARDMKKRGNLSEAAELLLKAANSLGSRGLHKRAAEIYEEAAHIFKERYMAHEYSHAIENATLMLVRMGSSPEVNKDIARINEEAGEVAVEANDFRKAADFFFRATDFATGEDSMRLILKAADSLENLADICEMEQDYDKTISLLRKVGRLYYSAGDDELGRRINERAARIALRWAKEAKEKKDFRAAGNAMAEAAQILQNEGDSAEATKLMMDAGDLYEEAGLHEKAGNIYDAAQEVYKLERLTTARKQAMSKAAESYLKMEGKDEVVAPLLIKAGNMFLEIGRPMRARWSFKTAAEIFEKLSENAAKTGDTQSEKTYLRFHAMCLKNWGEEERAQEVYQRVIDYFLNQAQKEAAKGNKDLEAISLEEAAEVLYEAGDTEKAQENLEHALELYVELADARVAAEEPDEGSKYYSKAAECAKKMGDYERSKSFHWIAAEKAEAAAKHYDRLGIAELSAVWLRTAGLEALHINETMMHERAVNLLMKSASGFKNIGELSEAFADLFVVFRVLTESFPDRKKHLKQVVEQMEEIVLLTQDEHLILLMSVVKPIYAQNDISALLILQENEDEMAQERNDLRALITLVRNRKSKD